MWRNIPIPIAGEIGNYYYGQGHPMKPQRIRMTHNLLLNYGLYRKMEVYVREKETSTVETFSFLSKSRVFLRHISRHDD